MSKDKKKRKPLLVSGVRQCGKTYLIKEFGKNEFEDVAYFEPFYLKEFITTVSRKKFF